MRVRFEWTTKDPLQLPVAYHQILQGIIYRNMKNDTRYSDFVHDEGFTYDNRQYRMFCFSNIFGNYKIADKKISFTGPLAFEVSSPDVYLIRNVADNVVEEGLTFGHTNYSDVDVLLSDYTVEEDDIIVKAISPITVYMTTEDKKTVYFSPDEEEFSFAVNDNFQRKYMAYFGVPAECDVWIEPVDVKSSDKCVTKYKGTYITGYQGIYRLTGPRKALDFLMQAGVGSKNSQGFGMIE